MKEFLNAKFFLFFLMMCLSMLVADYALADTITVQAQIDGRSQLTIRGNTAQWHHFDFEAPGLSGFPPTEVPTIINGANWTPVWPVTGSDRRVDCDCDSNEFTGVNPPLELADQTVTLNVIQGRDTVTIVQQPAASNNYELIVEFNDNSVGGTATYIIQLQTPFGSSLSVPSITEWGMILFMVLAGLGAVCYMRRQGQTVH